MKRTAQKYFLHSLIALGFLVCAMPVFAESLQDRQVAACLAISGKEQKILTFDIPAASNFISNRMISMTVGMGGSLSVDELVKNFSKTQNYFLVIIGKDEGVTAATLEMALEKIGAAEKRFSNTVCFAGDEKYAASLKAASQKAGITLLLPKL